MFFERIWVVVLNIQRFKNVKYPGFFFGLFQVNWDTHFYLVFPTAGHYINNL